jgi:hypothetical protein
MTIIFIRGKNEKLKKTVPCEDKKQRLVSCTHKPSNIHNHQKLERREEWNSP